VLLLLLLTPNHHGREFHSQVLLVAWAIAASCLLVSTAQLPLPLSVRVPITIVVIVVLVACCVLVLGESLTNEGRLGVSGCRQRWKQALVSTTRLPLSVAWVTTVY